MVRGNKYSKNVQILVLASKCQNYPFVGDLGGYLVVLKQQVFIFLRNEGELISAGELIF